MTSGKSDSGGKIHCRMQVGCVKMFVQSAWRQMAMELEWSRSSPQLSHRICGKVYDSVELANA